MKITKEEKIKRVIEKMQADGLNDGLEWEYDSIYVTRKEWESMAFKEIVEIITTPKEQNQ